MSRPQLSAATAAAQRVVLAIAHLLRQSSPGNKHASFTEVDAGGVSPEAPRSAGGLALGSLDGLDYPRDADGDALDAMSSAMRPSADGEGLASDDEWRALMLGTAVASGGTKQIEGSGPDS